jgi:hypothetical protein
LPKFADKSEGAIRGMLFRFLFLCFYKGSYSLKKRKRNAKIPLSRKLRLGDYPR